MDDHKKSKPANTAKGYAGKKGDAKPWEKMYAGKKKDAPAGQKAPVKSEGKKQGKSAKEFRDFLYLLPKRTTAKSMAKSLTFLERKSVEVWEDECVLEITTAEGVITFEDIRDSLEAEDEKVLSDLRMKQVISCDYDSGDAEMVRRIMEVFLKEFGGKIGSDTEDFTPFLNLEQL